jgi:DNA-binding CsgD family transcriptional regulator
MRHRATTRTTPSAVTFAKLLGNGPLAVVALKASLARLEFPAYIVSASGTVMHTNRPGDVKSARSSDRLRVELRRAVEDPAAARGAVVTPLRCGGSTPPYFLVTYPGQPSDRLGDAARRWSLTPKQKEVLSLVAEGFGNKTIAARLRVAERTVETHLTEIFRKAGTHGRTALLASLNRRAT